MHFRPTNINYHTYIHPHTHNHLPHSLDHDSSGFSDVMQMAQTNTPMSATALLQKADQMGSTRSTTNPYILVDVLV